MTLGTWPEQNACEDWWNEHRRELREAVTKERLVQQKRADKLEGIANFLWHLLDTIDTADGMYKEDDRAFRDYVYSAQQRRFEVSSSDGQKVWWTPGENPVPEPITPDVPPGEPPQEKEEE